MDHNLEDSLNLDTNMGVEFETTSDTAVSQADITLDSSTHEEGIPMEFDQIEEQPMLMDTGSEEIIVSDFMEEQFTLQEYAEQDHNVQETASADSSQQSSLTSQSETMIDLQFAQALSSSTQEVETQPKIISVKAALPSIRSKAVPKKNDTVVITTVPRQVAIAPKPSLKTSALLKSTFASKQLPIAPKPVVNRAVSTGFVKKVSLGGVVQGNTKGNVLTQINKQFVMMPAGASQKLKLVTACGTGVPTIQYLRTNSDQAQLIPTKSVPTSQSGKTVVAKVIMQDSHNQPAVLSKLVPAGNSTAASTSQTTSYVMQQKTVPISIHNKMIVTSPSKPTVKIASKTAPKQYVTIKSTTPSKLLPATTSHTQGTTTKKVVITQSPNQKVILKTTAPPKLAQLTKDGNVVNISHGQRSQLHQINIPGKGVQYIRLITPNTAPAKPPPTKTLVLADTIGNLIQITAEKLVSGQPPSLVMNENATTVKKLTSKSQQKLVRIAPAVSKAQPVSQQSLTRSSQSLLAPLSPMDSMVVPEAITKPEPVEVEDHEQESESEEEEVESKASLKALLEEATTEQTDTEFHTQEVEVEFERSQSSAAEEDTNSTDQPDSSSKTEEHPLIVIPSGYTKQQIVPERVTSGHSRHDDTLNSVLDEGDLLNTYQSPSASDIVSTDLALRPRKACNCTKSQCLKLYCDCFANGEFCNRCNCTNCYNNLEYEELRQKAIRSCLDRNPNAFRPKIGKAKDGGLDIIRRHNKGCNCKRSGCLKNYCECFEAKIACTMMCKCVGCRNVEDMVVRRRERATNDLYRPHNHSQIKQPCSFMTSEVIEAVCQCLLAAAVDGVKGAGDEAKRGAAAEPPADPVRDVIDEFSRCLQDIIGAAHQATPLTVPDEGRT